MQLSAVIKRNVSPETCRATHKGANVAQYDNVDLTKVVPTSICPRLPHAGSVFIGRFCKPSPASDVVPVPLPAYVG
jgi:hypothetical protein